MVPGLHANLSAESDRQNHNSLTDQPSDTSTGIKRPQRPESPDAKRVRLGNAFKSPQPGVHHDEVGSFAWETDCGPRRALLNLGSSLSWIRQTTNPRRMEATDRSFEGNKEDNEVWSLRHLPWHLQDVEPIVQSIGEVFVVNVSAFDIMMLFMLAGASKRFCSSNLVLFLHSHFDRVYYD